MVDHHLEARLSGLVEHGSFETQSQSVAVEVQLPHRVGEHRSVDHLPAGGLIGTIGATLQEAPETPSDPTEREPHAGPVPRLQRVADR